VKIEVRYQDLEGEEHEMVLMDFPARVFQHEYDHLQVGTVCCGVTRLWLEKWPGDQATKQRKEQLQHTAEQLGRGTLLALPFGPLQLLAVEGTVSV
jgi:peptide deformylase